MSSAVSPDGRFYVTSGTMDPDSPSYIVRRADTELLEGLVAGGLYHVLASRQMGKSSLMASTARRLTARGVQCSLVDLTQFSENKGVADDWYYALISFIADNLGLEFDSSAWWQENSLPSSLARLSLFFDKVVLNCCPGQIAIFLDEIDSTISLPFSDDFFAAIRAFYNKRATEPRFKRLNFVLLGVATPAQLIRDPTRTPFNVGRGVELTDFTFSEATPLAAGLHRDRERAEDLLRRILYWTDGHPYLTQTLCDYLVRTSTWDIDELVNAVFLSRRAARDEPNLRLVRERLTQGSVDLVSVLSQYKDILSGEPVRDEVNSPLHSALRLAGVVKRDDTGQLRIRNRIYQQVFSLDWVTSEMPVEPSAIARLPLEMAQAYVTHDSLRSLPEFRCFAGGVLARFCESRGLRDEALLVRIQTLLENDDAGNRRMVQSLIELDYGDLLMSFVLASPITAAALSPNGATVLVGSRDGEARLWSASSGEPIFPAFRHRASVTALAFSPDGKFLATGSDDHTAVLMRAKTWERIAVLRHEARIRSLAFSSDSRKLLTTSADGSAGIWHTSSGEAACAMLHHSDGIQNGAFDCDNRLVATVSEDRTAILWRLGLGGRFGSAFLHADRVTLIAFHPSGDAFVTAGDDGRVRVWDIRSESLLQTFAHETPVLDFAISPDGKQLVTGNADGRASLWDWGSAQDPRAILRHHDSILTVQFTPDGRRVLTGSADRTMRVWNSEDGRPIGRTYRHSGKVNSLACSADGMKVLTCDQDGASRLWRLETKADAMPAPIAHPAEITGAALGLDSAIILSYCTDNRVRIWTAEGKLSTAPLLHPARVHAVAYHPSGNRIVTGSGDGYVRIWSTAPAKLMDVWFAHWAPIRALSLSCDGKILVTGSDDHTARVWEIDDGNSGTACSRQRFGPPLEHRGALRTLAIKRDGTEILTGGLDGFARLWSRDSGKELGSPLEHSSPVSAVDFQSGESGLLLSAAGTSVYLWRMKENEDEPRPFVEFKLQYGDFVRHACFRHDGTRLLVVTNLWIYHYAMQESGPVHLSSRLLPGPRIEAIRWRKERDVVDVVQSDAGNSLRIHGVSLDAGDVAPVAGDPETLLSQWQWQLGRRITADRRVFPAF
jgi:WD40 repeat protein